MAIQELGFSPCNVFNTFFFFKLWNLRDSTQRNIFAIQQWEFFLVPLQFDGFDIWRKLSSGHLKSWQGAPDSSVWRNPKSERNRIRNFFPIPIFFDTESDTFFDTIFFRNRYRYFYRYQKFLNSKNKRPIDRKTAEGGGLILQLEFMLRNWNTYLIMWIWFWFTRFVAK